MLRRVLLRLSVVLIALLVFALVSEGGLRVYAHCCMPTRSGLSKASRPDPVLGYRLRPDLSAKVSMPQLELDFTFNTDAEGFRPMPPVPTGAGDPYKIVVLGDSFTFGLGVESDETYSAVLARALGRQSARPVEVLNRAVPGYSVVSMKRFVLSHTSEWEPDMIIVGLQDGEDTRELEMVSGFLFDRPLKLFGQASYLVEAIRSQLANPDDTQDRAALVRQNMDEIQAYCDEAGVEVVVLDILTRGGTQWCIEEIDKNCEPRPAFEFSGSVLATTPALTAEAESPYLYEHHLNPRGHEVVGQLLASYVLEKMSSPK